MGNNKSVRNVMLVLLLFAAFSSLAAAYSIGPNSVWDIGSTSYFVRLDDKPAYTGSCAGTIPAPHLNVQVQKKLSSNKWATPTQNWHIAWQYNVKEIKTGKIK